MYIGEDLNVKQMEIDYSNEQRINNLANESDQLPRDGLLLMANQRKIPLGFGAFGIVDH